MLVKEHKNNILKYTMRYFLYSRLFLTIKIYTIYIKDNIIVVLLPVIIIPKNKNILSNKPILSFRLFRIITCPNSKNNENVFAYSKKPFSLLLFESTKLLDAGIRHKNKLIISIATAEYDIESKSPCFCSFLSCINTMLNNKIDEYLKLPIMAYDLSIAQIILKQEKTNKTKEKINP